VTPLWRIEPAFGATTQGNHSKEQAQLISINEDIIKNCMVKRLPMLPLIHGLAPGRVKIRRDGSRLEKLHALHTF
jgi:hypothetical protein